MRESPVEHRQREYDVRCEWGAQGVALLATDCAVVVIVDVLSFCTAVDVAVGRGARVLPQRWADAAARPDVGPDAYQDAHAADPAAREARARGAVQAGRRDGPGPSLRPSSLIGLAPGTLLALPSPNGASLCVAAARHGATVFAGCLRNATAVACAAGSAARAREDRSASFLRASVGPTARCAPPPRTRWARAPSSPPSATD